MEDIAIIKGLTRWLTEPTHKVLKDIAVKDNTAYASDGRIGFAIRLAGKNGDLVSEDYPFDLLKGIIEDAKGLTKWYKISLDEFKSANENFISCVKDAFFENKRIWRERYTEVECPCCGETLYWDCEKEEVVKEREEEPVIDARNIEKVVNIVFDDGSNIPVNFYYLHILQHLFADKDVRFAVKKNVEGNDMLYMMSKDGSAYGALMPFRVSLECGWQADYTVHATRED